MFDWEDLRHFVALVRYGALSEAARRLKVDHATVSRRIAALEKALALRLVDRLPRRRPSRASSWRIGSRNSRRAIRASSSP